MRSEFCLLLAMAPLWGQSVTSQACLKCHPSIKPTHHGFEPASKQNILGDFTPSRLSLRGAPYSLEPFAITQSEITSKPAKYKVDFVLTGRRVQQYLTSLADGRLALLSPTWDLANKRWIHDIDAANPHEDPGDVVQVWNKNCLSCHTSGSQKNFDPIKARYQTTWRSSGADCETCHGPGENHLKGGPILNPAKLDAERSTMVCAQCHASRDVYADGFEAGQNYNDFFSPVMEYRMPVSEDPAFWADARPRWFANESTAFAQSQCFVKGGASCVTCHVKGHEATVVNACTGCHNNVDSQQHSHHKTATCADCHMPAVTTGLHANMRDHAISLPAPENQSIPNACNQCHKEKDSTWAANQTANWFGQGKRGKMSLRANAFTQAKQRSPASIPVLLQIFGEHSQGGWLRANAVGYLGNFSDDPSAYTAVQQALSDDDPLVRATAAVAIHPRAAQRETAATQLVKLLADPFLTVRLNSGIGLVSMGVRPFPGDDGLRFEEAKRLYKNRAALNLDQPQQQFAAGKFFFLSGEMEAAASAFRAALKLDPAIPANYLLARALAGKGDYAASWKLLKTIPRDDPQFPTAQTLLAEIEAKTVTKTPGQESFLEGQVQYQNKFYGAALKAFDQALKLEPKAQWALRARIARAICLAKLARPKEAEAAILAELPNAPEDVDLQLALVELLAETGRQTEAEQRIGQLVKRAPNAPMAFFWKSKLLLQSHRNEDAAIAAEEAIHLLPQFPEARNLLVRIYQTLGRTKEAAQQAEWLRDYQRSH